MKEPTTERPSILTTLSNKPEQDPLITEEQWRRIESNLAEKNREDAEVSDAIKADSDKAALRSFFYKATL